MKKILPLFLLTLLALTVSANAVTVRLVWDANPVEDNVTGYKLYTSTVLGDYTNAQVITLTGPNSTTGVVTDLAPGGTYHFVVTAFNAAGESGYSSPVSATFQLKPGPPLQLRIGTTFPW